VEKILIAGIDPGTVSGYAIIDIEGNLVSIGSERELTTGDLILKIIKHGKIYAIGSDVYPCPNLTNKIATRIGVRVISPDHDLKYLEKIKIVDTYLKKQKKIIKINNKHEKDALAAALYGLKKINGLLKKIDDHLKEHNKIYLKEQVKRRVLVDNVPIVEALRELS